MMEYCIKKYIDEYKSVISELISNDQFVREDIMGCLNRYPQFGQIVEGEFGILGVGAFTGTNKMTSMTLYVTPSKRNEGIGSLLLNSIEEKMRSVGVEKAICDFLVNEQEQSFMYKNGYKKWFCSNNMTYTGVKLPVAHNDIVNYEDRDYEECQKIYSESFHKMRLSVGLESKLSQPSAEDRKDYKDSAENSFVMRDNNQIVAFLRIEDNEIVTVAVGVEHQGKGFGKSMISFAVNELLDRGCTNLHLWVVDGNPAKSLYEKLGFKMERKHEFVIKSIK